MAMAALQAKIRPVLAGPAGARQRSPARPDRTQERRSSCRRSRRHATMPMNRLARSNMSAPAPDTSQQPMMSNKQLAFIVYILYFVSYFTGLTGLIGVIIAHVQVGIADDLLRTHYQFSNPNILDRRAVSGRWNHPDLRADRYRDLALVVHLVAGAEHQGRPGLE
jgi:hypothetical protein